MFGEALSVARSRASVIIATVDLKQPLREQITRQPHCVLLCEKPIILPTMPHFSLPKTVSIVVEGTTQWSPPSTRSPT